MKERLRKLSGVDFGPLSGRISTNPGFIPGQLDGIAVRMSPKKRISVLVLEIKTPGDTSSIGQHRMLKELSRIKNFCVVSVGVSGRLTSKKAYWFDPITVRVYKDGKAGKRRPTTLQKFEESYRVWYRAADNDPQS
jgi:hypothetical protein